MRGVISFLLLIGMCFAQAQEPDSTQTILLEDLTITAYQEIPERETSIHITSIGLDTLTSYSHHNLTELMSRTPGVSMLTMGMGISKPVIRGLYGNRTLVLLSGLKFDNQQWQEEHGLGLTDFGLSRVELIKGPMSVLYGSEAMGGVINLIEEKKPALHQSQSEIGLRLNSNTLGGMVQAGYKVNNGSSWWRLRIGSQNHADYTDGHQDRVLNSRFDGYYLKGTYGFQRNRWTSTNNFMSSYNRFGFIFNDAYSFIETDKRWSRDLGNNPAHMVLLNIFSSENKLQLKNNNRLSINVGVQSNDRMENEGSGKISLNMHLLTFQYLLKLEKQVSTRSRLIISHLGSFEDNTNFGARKIVPDAYLQEANLSAFIETVLRPGLILENGAGLGEKWIKTYFTPNVNGPEQEVRPFSKFAPYYNLFSGITYFPSARFNIKLNVATGVRIPNLAELSSNGLHEGVFTYEIGDPALENEQNLALNLVANYHREWVSLSISPFYNHFFNYVYLAPTNEEWYGFPVYRYRQQDAIQYGTESTIRLTPSDPLQLSLTYEGMMSKTSNGHYTPYTPAKKLTPGIRYSASIWEELPVQFYAEASHCFAQNQAAPEELSTPAYWLVNAGVSTSFQRNGHRYQISLSGKNLMNEAYYDHLSRFKYFGLLNSGRNISFIVKITFERQNDRL